MGNNKPSNSSSADHASILQTFNELQSQTAQAHASFQQSMAQSHSEFLRATEKTFLAFAQLLSGQPLDLGSDSDDHSAIASSDRGGEVAPPEPPAAPAEALSNPLQRSNLPPSSAPNVQEPPRERLPAAPPPQAPTDDRQVDAGSTASPAESESARDVEGVMVSVMSQVTGYPAEMLTREMELESDLGIDSIKRVEILSEVQNTVHGSLTVDPQEMATLRTIGEIADYLDERVKKN